MPTFTNSTGLTIADNTTVSQTLVVSGLSGPITDIQVILNDLTHTFPGDLDFLLVAPDGTSNLVFLSDMGGNNDLLDDDFTFSDSAATVLTDAAMPAGGTFKPRDVTIEAASNWGLSLTVNHATTAGSATFASAFGSLASANGTWTLYIRDDLGQDTGDLAGWSLEINAGANLAPPVITSDGGGATATVQVAENSTAVTTVTATDADLTFPTFSIIGGDDFGLFQIDSQSGALSFITAPNFEAPADSNGDNSYIVIVEATDGEFTDTQTITVNVTNVAGEAPRITSNGGEDNATVFVAENSKTVTTVTAVDDDSNSRLSFAIVGGADAGKFTINSRTGLLTFKNAPDFENPGDSNGDNTYQVIVRSSDGSSLFDTQTIDVVVTNVSGVINGTDKNDTVDKTHTVKGQPLPSNEEDTISGQNGNDNLSGLNGNDTIFGNKGNDKINGDNDDDTLYGDEQFLGDVPNLQVLLAPVIAAPVVAGNDTLNGGNGDDTLFGDAETVSGWVKCGDDKLDGGAGDDTLYGDARNVEGQSQQPFGPTSIVQDSLPQGGNDYLLGGSGNDRLYGDWETNGSPGLTLLVSLPIVNAHGGNDKLDGGAGNDDLWGNGGDDIFIFGKKGGRDTIWDFNQNEEGEHDRIDLTAYKFDEWRSFKGNISNDRDGNAIIKLSPTDQIRVMGVSRDELQSSDFIL